MSSLTFGSIEWNVIGKTLSNEIVLAMCGTAFKNKGVQAMLDAVIHFMPSPLDVPAITGILDDKDETPADRKSSDDEPFSSLAFKIMFCLRKTIIIKKTTKALLIYTFS